MITRVDDGAQIAWEPHGIAGAPAVLLLHSLGSSTAMWKPQITSLSEDHRLIAVDTRGHGRSDAPDGPYTVDRLGRDVLAVVDAAGLDRVHVVGLSLGGQMAMWLALHAPARVQSVVLANTAAELGNADAWQSRIDAVGVSGMTSIRDAVMGRWFAPGFADRHPARFTELCEVFDTTDPVGYAACCAALRDSDLRSEVGAITVPTLIIGGALDMATPPADAEWLHHHIAGSRLTIFDDAAHLSNLDRPDDFTDRLRTFLAG
ncbi:MAG: pcaD [Ilumatobacteraceae bacterium]|jgi:3-oxoadipate enol-lactonase|nr:pcaD [Ilumatobacteraceae bacterium]